MLPQDEPHTEDVALLGNRPRDVQADWSGYYDKYPNLCIQKKEYWKNLRDAWNAEAPAALNGAMIQGLNPEQRLVYDRFVCHLADTINPNRQSPRPLLMQVEGQGGTGKSYLIQAVSQGLDFLKADCVARAAPTGIAANNIDGMTIHSMLHLPVSRQLGSIPALSGNELASIQNRMSNIQYIILDEKSMVGLRMLHNIDQRLRQIFPDCQHD